MTSAENAEKSLEVTLINRPLALQSAAGVKATIMGGGREGEGVGIALGLARGG